MAVFQSVVSSVMPSMSAVKFCRIPTGHRWRPTPQRPHRHPRPRTTSVRRQSPRPLQAIRAHQLSPNRGREQRVAATSKFNSKDTEPAMPERSPTGGGRVRRWPPSTTAPASAAVDRREGVDLRDANRARGAMPMRCRGRVAPPTERQSVRQQRLRAGSPPEEAAEAKPPEFRTLRATLYHEPSARARAASSGLLTKSGCEAGENARKIAVLSGSIDAPQPDDFDAR